MSFIKESNAMKITISEDKKIFIDTGINAEFMDIKIKGKRNEKTEISIEELLKIYEVQIFHIRSLEFMYSKENILNNKEYRYLLDKSIPFFQGLLLDLVGCEKRDEIIEELDSKINEKVMHKAFESLSL
ncbi:hypothetical protein [Sporosarcina sp. FSL W7-1283]|uniref:hypothetical protein n=1 Tax=Sporosarcina sp. FSL W7-1283 TaxID=2921560 RepID=UPI0030FB962D